MKKRIDKVDLIIDIKSSSVRGVLLSSRKPREILLELSVELPRSSRSVDDIRDKMILATKTIIHGIVENFLLRKYQSEPREIPDQISSVQYILSSPWVISQAQLISTSFKEKTRITKSLVESLVNDKLAKPSIHVAKHGHQTGTLKLVERKVLSVSPNGYEVSDWLNKMANNLEISFLVSSMSAKIADELSQLASEIVETKSIRFHSALIQHYIYSRHLVPDASNHVCVHIHSDVTDAVCVNTDGSVYFTSFPIGYNTLVRRLSIVLGLKKHTAESMMSLYSQLHLDHVHNRKIGVLIEKIFSSWVNEFQNFMKITDIGAKSKIHTFVTADKFAKVFIRLSRVPGTHSTVEQLDDIMTLCQEG
jgi:hypothetical protein